LPSGFGNGLVVEHVISHTGELWNDLVDYLADFFNLIDSSLFGLLFYVL